MTADDQSARSGTPKDPAGKDPAGKDPAGKDPAGNDLAGVARDASTIIDVLAAFEADGYSGQFVAREQGEIECVACKVRTPAGAVANDSLRRLEGASDPADMLAIAALTCPSCGTRGTLVVNYGPEATAEDGDVLLALDPPPPPEPESVRR